MKLPHTISILAVALLLLPACNTRTNTAGPVDAKTAMVNAASVAAPLIEGSARIAVPLILTKNPQLEGQFTVTATIASAVLSAQPTAAGFAAALRVAFPQLEPAQAVQIGAALESAYAAGAALYQAQTGRTLELTALIGDPQYRAAADLLVAALVRGTANGIADWHATR